MDLDMQPSINYRLRTLTTVSALAAARKRSDIYLFIVIFIIVISLTPLLIAGGLASSPGIALSALVSLIVAVLIILWPVVGFYVVALCTLLVEQSPLLTPVLTDHLDIFYWPAGLEGLIERPIGFLFIFILLTVACRRILNRQHPLQGGKLFWPFLCYFLCALGGVAHGLINGGDFKIIVIEIRPFWYMFISYLIGYNLVTCKRHIYLFFWFVILSAGVKALQGLYIYLIFLHGSLAGHREIMSHEESFFFVSLLVLLILFYLHHCYRPQLRIILLILPCAIVALVANQRRADYIALLVGLAAIWLLIFCLKPRTRKKLLTLMLICVVLGVSYIAIFANSTGGIGAPAHAIVSIFRPDAQNAPSNLYRTIENFDLKYTARQNPLFGFGFGTKFLQPQRLADISIRDLNYLYVPHNTLYWIWMRLGLIGFFALWYLLGTAIIRAGMIVRSLRDPYLQLTAMYIVGVIFIEIVVAYADYQLFSFRNVIYIGLLAGILMKLPALDEAERERETTHGVAHSMSSPAMSNRWGRHT
jgi:O-Antigen ligase